eukprot:Rhum_TRINITY_DN3068_c0_g1::Rhum_TRINITY_DN3068_c0_g1_i1::g.9540::m.9540
MALHAGAMRHTQTRQHRNARGLGRHALLRSLVCRQKRHEIAQAHLHVLVLNGHALRLALQNRHDHLQPQLRLALPTLAANDVAQQRHPRQQRRRRRRVRALVVVAQAKEDRVAQPPGVRHAVHLGPAAGGASVVVHLTFVGGHGGRGAIVPVVQHGVAPQQEAEAEHVHLAVEEKTLPAQHRILLVLLVHFAAVDDTVDLLQDTFEHNQRRVHHSRQLEARPRRHRRRRRRRRVSGGAFEMRARHTPQVAFVLRVRRRADAKGGGGRRHLAQVVCARGVERTHDEEVLVDDAVREGGFTVLPHVQQQLRGDELHAHERVAAHDLQGLRAIVKLLGRGGGVGQEADQAVAGLLLFRVAHRHQPAVLRAQVCVRGQVPQLVQHATRGGCPAVRLVHLHHTALVRLVTLEYPQRRVRRELGGHCRTRLNEAAPLLRLAPVRAGRPRRQRHRQVAHPRRFRHGVRGHGEEAVRLHVVQRDDAARAEQRAFFAAACTRGRRVALRQRARLLAVFAKAVQHPDLGLLALHAGEGDFALRRDEPNDLAHASVRRHLVDAVGLALHLSRCQDAAALKVLEDYLVAQPHSVTLLPDLRVLRENPEQLRRRRRVRPFRGVHCGKVLLQLHLRTLVQVALLRCLRRRLVDRAAALAARVHHQAWRATRKHVVALQSYVQAAENVFQPDSLSVHQRCRQGAGGKVVGLCNLDNSSFVLPQLLQREGCKVRLRVLALVAVAQVCEHLRVGIHNELGRAAVAAHLAIEIPEVQPTGKKEAVPERHARAVQRCAGLKDFRLRHSKLCSKRFKEGDNTGLYLFIDQAVCVIVMSMGGEEKGQDAKKFKQRESTGEINAPVMCSMKYRYCSFY